MNRLSAIFVSGVRHLLLVVAILATLTATFGVHLHLAVAKHHQHAACGSAHDGHHHHDGHDGADQVVVSKFTGVTVDGLSDGQGKALPDPDSCGHCHCQVPSTDLPASVPLFAASGFSIVVHLSHDILIPDGITYQPDPPPIRG